MKKYITLSLIFFLLMPLGACADEVTPNTVSNPSAQPLLITMTEIAKTVEVIGQTATAYSVTPTNTPTPTSTPDQGVVNNLISESIDGQLISTFGADITVGAVKFGPIGAQEYKNLYVEINCVGDNNTACPVTNVIIAVLEACKDKKKKMLENVPDSLETLTITIFDPPRLPRVVEIDWRDVKDYLNDKMRGDVLDRLIRYVQ